MQLGSSAWSVIVQLLVDCFRLPSFGSRPFHHSEQLGNDALERTAADDERTASASNGATCAPSTATVQRNPCLCPASFGIVRWLHTFGKGQSANKSWTPNLPTIFCRVNRTVSIRL